MHIKDYPQEMAHPSNNKNIPPYEMDTPPKSIVPPNEMDTTKTKDPPPPPQKKMDTPPRRKDYPQIEWIPLPEQYYTLFIIMTLIYHYRGAKIFEFAAFASVSHRLV